MIHQVVTYTEEYDISFDHFVQLTVPNLACSTTDII